MEPRICYGIEPMLKLAVEIVQVAERAAEEKVFADVSERSLDLSFRLRPIGATGPRLEAKVSGEIDEGAIICKSLDLV